MKGSNCLKLVLLCGCPPDNSNFQLQLHRQETASEETLVTNTSHQQAEFNTLSAPRGSRSNDSLNLRDRIIKKCFFDQETSDMSFNSVPEISYQDEQRAIALILEYLKMKNSEQPKFNKYEGKPLTHSESNFRGVFKKSNSFLVDREAHRFSEKGRKDRGKSLESNLTHMNETNQDKAFKTFRYKLDKGSDEVDIDKACIRSPKVKVPFSFFKRFSNQTVYRSKTIVETNDLEIKEVLVSNEKVFDKTKEKPSKGFNSSDSRFIREKKFPNQNFNSKHPVGETNSHSLSPDTCMVLNPNIIDEVSPYVLRFVKTYLGDFRKYLLESYIGVDSISLDYFDSMINVLENFPIDDLTLFKNLKYSLASLFPPPQDGSINLNNSNPDKTSRKYEEKLPPKQLIEPTCYKYTIRSKEPIYLDKSLDKFPSFVVRFYPVGNKLHRNSSVQTEESTLKLGKNTFRRSYFSKSKEDHH